MDNPLLSVVVCTYNRATLLCEVLESLLEQSVDPSLYEVIVIDNNSTDETPRIARHFVERHHNVRVFRETRQGLSYARNRGCKEARAEWIAYIDDDARAHRNYVERALQTIRQCDFECFGGVYLPWYRDGRPEWYKEQYASNRYDQGFLGYLPEHKYASGGNFLIKKTLLEHIGGFAVELGMCGSAVAYGEETRLQIDLRKMGHKIGFDPELLIDHYVAPYKQHPSWFFKSAFRIGESSWVVNGRKVTIFALLLNVVALLLLPLILLPKNIVYLILRRSYWQNLIIDTFSRSAGILGRLKAGIYEYRLINRIVDAMDNPAVVRTSGEC